MEFFAFLKRSKVISRFRYLRCYAYLDTKPSNMQKSAKKIFGFIRVLCVYFDGAHKPKSRQIHAIKTKNTIFSNQRPQKPRNLLNLTNYWLYFKKLTAVGIEPATYNG